MTLLAPGLWLQRLTTREPTLDQLEVSIRALREVLDYEGRLDAGGPTRGGDGVDGDDAHGRGRVDRRVRRRRGDDRLDDERRAARARRSPGWRASTTTRRRRAPRSCSRPPTRRASRCSSPRARRRRLASPRSCRSAARSPSSRARDHRLGADRTRHGRRPHRRADPRDRRAREDHVPDLAGARGDRRSRSTCPTSRCRRRTPRTTEPPSAVDEVRRPRD